MTDVPLYCECGNRLGLRRSDGAFVSRHRDRTVTVPAAFEDVYVYEVEIACEKCQRTTEVDKLRTAKVG